MEQLNRVELRGIVGCVKMSEIGGRNFLRMTVATNLAYRDREGCAVIETTWHNVVAFEGEGMTGLDLIGRGDKVEVTGRIRNQKCTAEDGTDRTYSEICATKVQKLDVGEPLQYQF